MTTVTSSEWQPTLIEGFKLTEQGLKSFMSDYKGRGSSMMRESQGSSAHNALVNNKKIRGPSVVFFEET
jgi:hypothetical protein